MSNSVNTYNYDTNDAVSTASRWVMSKGLLLPFEFRQCITKVKTTEERIVRVRYRGRHRKVVVHEAATKSQKRTLYEPIDPSSIDPWQDEPEALPGKTHQLCECSTCRGNKKVICQLCHGNILVYCDHCRGSGAVLSQRTGNPINCPTCRGAGHRRCTCRNGQTNCPACNGKGKVDRWFAIEEFPIDVIRVDGSVVLRQLIGDDTAAYLFDSPPVHTVRVTDSWSGGPMDTVPPQLEKLIATPSMVVPTDPLADRIERVDIQVLTGSITDVSYKVAFTESKVRVVGGQVVEPQDTPGRRTLLRPLWRRLIFVGLPMLFFFFIGMVLAGSYLNRHEWYENTPASTALVLLAVFLPLTVLPVMTTLMLPQPRRRLKLIGGLSAAPLLVLAIMLVLRTTGDPSISNARAAWKRGETAQAKKELRAAIDLDIDRFQAQVVHDQIVLQELSKLNSPTEIRSRAAKELYLKKNKANVTELVYSLALTIAARKHKRNDPEGVDKLLRKLPKHLQARPEVTKYRAWIALMRLAECISHKNRGCIYQQIAEARKYKAKPAAIKRLLDVVLKEQTKHIAAALAIIVKRKTNLKGKVKSCEDAEKAEKYAKRLELKPAVPGWNDKQKKACARFLKRWKVEEAARRKREEARRRRELARIVAQHRRKARLEAVRRKRKAYRERLRKRRECYRNGSGSAKCCDGTLSMSCGCGGGRGCCSHHRGVCGCSCDDI